MQKSYKYMLRKQAVMWYTAIYIISTEEHNIKCVRAYFTPTVLIKKCMCISTLIGKGEKSEPRKPRPPPTTP